MLSTPFGRPSKSLPRPRPAFTMRLGQKRAKRRHFPGYQRAGGGGVQITVNGKQREVAEGTSIATLLKELELPPPQVAVEVNLQLVPRARHAEHRLAAGDRLEVVTLVGGG